MDIMIKSICEGDMEGAVSVWNEVVSDGVAFPQLECLDLVSAREFFGAQSFVGVARLAKSANYTSDVGGDKAFDDISKDSDSFGDTSGDSSIVGIYILHPNNIGRCGHICNASYAVSSKFRGLGVGEMLVSHCLDMARQLGFGVLQFNAVVATNQPALALYKKLGFTQLGVIPNGFKLDNGEFADIIPHYISL